MRGFKWNRIEDEKDSVTIVTQPACWPLDEIGEIIGQRLGAR